MKFAVRYLKNTFYPLNLPDSMKLEDGQMVIVRTEKGEEALKAFIVNSQIEKIWEHSKNKPEPLPVIRTMTQRDLQTLEEIKKEEVTAYFKCQALVKQHKLSMNLVQCRITFDRRKITFYYTAPERVDFRGICCKTGRPRGDRRKRVYHAEKGRYRKRGLQADRHKGRHHRGSGGRKRRRVGTDDCHGAHSRGRSAANRRH